jgi:hypothetical protein
VVEARGQFGKGEKGELPPLEAVTRGLVNTNMMEKAKCVL